MNHFEEVIVFAIATINPCPKINKSKTLSQVAVTDTLKDCFEIING